jgi:histidinol-phosphate aminotransferase
MAVAARLNANEAPVTLPRAFFDELAGAIVDLPLNRYPDTQMTDLREGVAALFDHDVAGTWTANGSNEILTQLLQAYGGPGRKAVTFEPTYMLHSRLSWLTSTELVRLRLPADFVLTEAQVAEAVEAAPDVVFICSPNNPTGNSQPSTVVRALAEALPVSLLIVDEAYGEFVPHNTSVPLLATHDNVAVVRTFSKAFALAGARIGYVLTSPSVVEDLQRVRLPYHMSALTQTAGSVALRHRSEALELLAELAAQRERIFHALGRLEGVTVYPSDANFVLFVPPRPAAEVWQALLDRGVLVRDLSSVVSNSLRVTAGTQDETDLFLKSIEEVLG